MTCQNSFRLTSEPLGRGNSPAMAQKDKISLLLTGLAWFFLLGVQVRILGYMFLFVSALHSRRAMLIHLITIPLVETSLVLDKGITLGKVLYLFYMAVLLRRLIFSRGTSRNGRFLLAALLAFLLVGTITELFAVIAKTATLSDVYSSIVFRSSRLLLLYLLYNAIVERGLEELKNSIRLLSSSLLIFIPLLSYHIATNSQVLNWRNTVMRYSLEGTDANELGALMTCLLPFLLTGLSFVRISDYAKLFTAGILCLAILDTGSRGTFISLLFVLLSVVSLKILQTSFRPLIALSAVGIGFILFNLNATETVLARFSVGEKENVNALTGGRLELWLNTLKGCMQKPIFGHGSIKATMKAFNKFHISRDNVAHNTILQFLFEYGLFGIASAVLLCWKYAKVKFNALINNHHYQATTIAFGSLLVSSMALSWLWREVLWVFLAIFFAYSQLLKSHEDSSSDSSNPKLGC